MFPRTGRCGTPTAAAGRPRSGRGEGVSRAVPPSASSMPSVCSTSWQSRMIEERDVERKRSKPRFSMRFRVVHRSEKPTTCAAPLSPAIRVAPLKSVSQRGTSARSKAPLRKSRRKAARSSADAAPNRTGPSAAAGTATTRSTSRHGAARSKTRSRTTAVISASGAARRSPARNGVVRTQSPMKSSFTTRILRHALRSTPALAGRDLHHPPLPHRRQLRQRQGLRERRRGDCRATKAGRA